MIILVRHGATEFTERKLLQGWIDVPLNVVGKKQIDQTAIKIRDLFVTWDVVISSDLLRAKESGEIIANYIEVPLFTYNGLRERRYGEYEGKSIEFVQMERKRSDQIAEKGGEKKSDFVARVQKVMTQIEYFFVGKNVIVVTHGAFIKNYANSVLGLEIECIGNGQILHINERKII